MRSRLPHEGETMTISALACLLALLTVTACAPASLADRRDADRSRCLSMGFAPGTDAYKACRITRD